MWGKPKQFHKKKYYYELGVDICLRSAFCPDLHFDLREGPVSLCVFALDTQAESSRRPPKSPLIFNETLSFKQKFDSPNKVSCDRRLLGNKHLFVELVQWGDCDNYKDGNTCAEYCTLLSEFLPKECDLPFSLDSTHYNGVEKKVLMKPTLGLEDEEEDPKVTLHFEVDIHLQEIDNYCADNYYKRTFNSLNGLCSFI